jgi:CubicO group peptidase (beta-lactamase class C family)
MRYKRILFYVLFILLLNSAWAQEPQLHWEQYETPEEAGFSSEKLAEAKALFDTLDAAAFLVIYNGRVLASWGDVNRRYMCHSVRKSFLSALYGIRVDDGTVDLNKTLAELNIDDKDKLTETEKEATIRDLLKARSGVYHPAAYETEGMKAARPKRGSHKRDTFWYYNNWDFNTLCTIFKQETGDDFFADFKKRIADPIKMEDFRLMNCYYHLEPENSVHPAYPFRMSARDAARFGLLFLREGQWNGKQIISKKWIKESTSIHSHTDNRGGGYGYLWWILGGEFKELGMYSALGVGSQMIAVIPEANIVIVQRVDTYTGKQEPPNARLFKMILEAKVSDAKPNPKLMPLQNTPSFKRPELILLEDDAVSKYLISDYQMGRRLMSVKKMDNELMLDSPHFGKYKLLPYSDTKFVVEDLEQFLNYEFDTTGRPVRITLHQTLAMADLYSTLMEQGIEAAVKQYVEMKKKGIEISEYEMNDLGYQLLRLNKLKESIGIFELNVKAYPQSFNVYDSLGEAYMINGDNELAIQNFEKSLELNPRNTNAAEMIKKIKEKN